MPGSRKKRPTVEEELQEVRTLAAGPITPEARERIRHWLGSSRSLVVARAARTVKDHALGGCEDDLLGALRRLYVDPVKTDPGCQAKLAVIEALDGVGHPDPEPFLVAARYIQLEPAWGPPVDTASGLRARAIGALANLGHHDLLLVAGELLADREAPVRLAAAEAVAHGGDRAGAGLLLFMVRHGDEDPMVHMACMTALLDLAPDHGVPLLGSLLSRSDDPVSELAGMALGQSGRDDAAELLIARIEARVLSADRAPLVRALGFHRSDRALEVLTGMIAEGSLGDARGALEALASRRFESRVRERVRAAVDQSGRSELETPFQTAFPAEPE